DKNVRAQKQRGQTAVTIRVPLGDLSATQLRGLAQLAREMSAEDQVRTTAEQNLVIRFISRDALPALHARLVSLGLALPGPRKIPRRPVPHYHLFPGGKFDGTSFGRLAAKVPARRAPQALTRLLELYASDKQRDESPEEFFARVPLPRVQSLLADLTEMAEPDATPDDFIDLGEHRSFEVVLQEGECAA